MNDLKLDPRLSLAASFVRSKSVVCDIGTDHGYLPISLLLSGKIEHAIAADINKSPLQNAKENAEKFGISDKISFYQTNGLSDIPLDKYDSCDIIICGMGGELIGEIISASELTRRSNTRLILQPMTKISVLRSFLSEGYEILDEGICCALSKLYQCISCRYTGKKTPYTKAELAVGKINIKRGENNPLYRPLLNSYITKCEKEIAGRAEGGLNTEEQEALLYDLKQLLSQ